MRKLLAFTVIAVGLVAGVPTTSSAGGWVVVSLDSVPAVGAGDRTEIGFTLLGHGVEPINADDLSVVLTGPDGRSERFEAVQDGAVGHHVATIIAADAGDYRWSVASDLGELADLGTLEVSAPSGGSAWTWDVAQAGTAVLALVLAATAAVDVRRTRRHRRADPVLA